MKVSSLSLSLPDVLSQTEIALNEAGPEFSAEHLQVKSLADRLANERFHLAVLGQFKRGKSTFINALLGEELLPAAVVPLTAIPTFLLWGPQINATIFFQQGRQNESHNGLTVKQLNMLLSQVITEQGNPCNKKNIARVEISYPSFLLNKGVVLIDTPGIGSTLQHNTEMTLSFLPQCDAAIFIISADPPITGVEVEFLKMVRNKVARIFYVVNKADYLNDGEKDTYVNFLRQVLMEQVGFNEDCTIFSVSSRQGLDASLTRNNALLLQSGMHKISEFLIDFISREKNNVLQEALAGKTTTIITQALMHLQLILNSIQMPFSELDHSLDVFQKKIKEAEQQRILAGDLLAGDRKRLVHFLEEQAEQLRKRARTHLLLIVERSLEHSGDNLHETLLIKNISEAIPVFFEAELKTMADMFNESVTEVLSHHQQRADELIETVRMTAAELFSVPYHAPKSSEAFKMTKEPYWVTYKLDAKLSPIPKAILGRLLPQGVQRSMTIKHYKEKIEQIVINNVENLRWATLQNLDQAFRVFGSILDERLQATISSTHGALQAVRSNRINHSRSMEPEIKRLQNMKDKMESLQKNCDVLLSTLNQP
jgi:GTP-binding protein EngB required for normal cell division